MRRAVLLAVGGFLAAVSVTAGSTAVREDLAAMVEEVVVATGLSVNISSTTRTSANINQISETSVCDASVAAAVARLQKAFDAHPSIYRNFGPAIVSVTSPDGARREANPADLTEAGVLPGCTSIYVSVHPTPRAGERRITSP